MYKVLVFTCLVALGFGASLENRIVGGEDAEVGEFPHQISLRFQGTHSCGGSILHPLYILTAAHCVQGRENDVKRFTVVAGSVLLSSGGDRHEIEKIIFHEKYNEQPMDNDIAILKLKKPIELDVNKQTIALPKEDTIGGETVEVSGWGLTSYPGEVPDHLQKMMAISYENHICDRFLENGPLRVKNQSIITPGMLCAFHKRTIGVCMGDSGGPLIIREDDGPVIAGVVSFGIPCGTGVPDVYARVYYYLDWIHKHTDNVLLNN